MNLPFFIARRSLNPARGRFSGFVIRLAIIATGLSVATMILAAAFITGFKQEIRGKLFQFWAHVHISPYSPNASTLITPQPIARDLDLESRVQALPEVASMDAFALRPVILNAHRFMEGLQLKGVYEDFSWSDLQQVKGHFPRFDTGGYSLDLMISRKTAERMNLDTGSSVQMYFLEPGSIQPRIRKGRISGIFHTGMEEVDRYYALCDIRLLQRINGWSPQQVNGYQVRLFDESQSKRVSDQIFHEMLEPPLTTHTLREIFPNIYDWLSLQDVNGRVVMGIMTLVSVMNLSVVLLILIMEQARMVGILKTLGMTTGAMRRIFLYHAGFIACLGVLLGNFLALGICYLQTKTGFLKLSEENYYIAEVPIGLVWWHPMLISLGTVIICLICLWIPSLYIRKMSPVKVLRFK